MPNSSLSRFLPVSFGVQYYTNNRTNSFVEDGVLYLQPTLLADRIGDAW